MAHKNSNTTFAQASDDASDTGLCDFVMTALRATRRFPCPGLPAYFNRDNVMNLYLEEHPGGWVANLAFRHVPPGLPNTIGTPDAHPFPSERLAFLAGAGMLCGLVTGSEELPFMVVGNQLIVAAYR